MCFERHYSNRNALLTVAVLLTLRVAAQAVDASPMAPLTAEQRDERESYLFNKRGLQFGVPQAGYARALARMRAMERQAAASRMAGAAGGAPASATGNWNWNFIGPQPMSSDANFGGVHPDRTFTFDATGRITAVVVDPQSPKRIFVGAAGGGVWMSTDGGNRFQSIFDAQPTQAIGSIALDDKNTKPSTIYVGTGEGHYSVDSYYGQGIFKSTDLGKTWVPLASGTFDHVGIGKLAIDTSRNPPYLFAAATPYVRSATRANATSFEADLSKGGLWRSTDGGASWTQYPGTATFGCGLLPNTATNPCPADDVAIDPSNPNTVYVAIRFNSVFRSTDGGNTWKRACFTNDSPCTFPNGLNKVARQTLAVTPAAAGTVYAILGAPSDVEYAGFYKSTDSGETWQAQKVPTVTLTDPDTKIVKTLDGTDPNNRSQSRYDQALLVDPRDSSHVFFGGVGIYESTDSGKGWRFLAENGGTHADQHTLAPALTTGGSFDGFFVGNDGGVFRYGAGGTPSFISLNATISAGQIQGIALHPTDDNQVIAGFQDNGTQGFTGNLNWDATDVADGGFALFDPTDPSFAYHTRQSDKLVPQILTSTDGGAHWNYAPTGALKSVIGSDPASFYPPLAVDPNVAHRVFIGAHHVYVSTDGMFSWQQQEGADLTGGCTDDSCALQDIQFAPSDSSRAYALSKHPAAIGGSSTPFKVFNTTQENQNAGATWTDVTGNLQAAFPSGLTAADTQATSIGISPSDPSVAYISLSGFTTATGIGHIYKTTNFGATWALADGAGGAAPLPDVPTLKVLVDRADVNGNTVFVGTDISVFRSTDGGSTWAAFNHGAIPAVPVFDMAQNDHGVVVVGTHGRGAFQSVNLCGPIPATGCFEPTKKGASVFQLKANADASKRSLSWKWAGETPANFGDPANGSTAYELCVYDGTPSLVMTAIVTAGGTCGAKSCWTTTKTGFKYTNKNLTPDGLQQIALRQGAGSKATINMKGKGTNLVFPTLPLNQTTAVVVQLKNSAGSCWDATYSAPATKNDTTQFNDKSD